MTTNTPPVGGLQQESQTDRRSLYREDEKCKNILKIKPKRKNAIPLGPFLGVVDAALNRTLHHVSR